MQPGLLVSVIVTLAVVVGLPGPATAQEAGNQRFVMIIVGEGNVGRAIASGLFTGVGTFVETEEDVGLFTFGEGTLLVRGTFDEESTTFNPRTCIGTFETSGRFVVLEGTGAFEGTTGSGRLTGRAVFGTNRTSEGCGEEELFAVAVFRLNGDLNIPARAAAA